jgi:hypothetical protein
MIENDSLVESGTYDELKSNENGAFNEFIKTYFEKKKTLKENLIDQEEENKTE